jgi:hypothetical protein
MANGWIGVDLDGTLATYDEWRGVDHIGEPIEPMVERVKGWIAEGITVKIMTARVSHPGQKDDAVRVIDQWCVKVFGMPLNITCCKDYGMYELWDDRAIQVERNTGRRIGPEPKGPVTP